MDCLQNLFPGLQTQAGMCFPEGNQALVVVQIDPVFFLLQGIPFDGIDRVRRFIAVGIELSVPGRLGAEDLFTGLHKGNALGEHHKSSGQPVHSDLILPGFTGSCQNDPVKQGVVVMAGNVVDTLGRFLCPIRHAHKTVFQIGLGNQCAGYKTGKGIVKDAAPQLIPNGIAEEGKTWNHMGISLNGQGTAGFGKGGVHGPAFTVENNIGVVGMNGCHHFPDGLNIDQAHQIKAEAVNVVFIRPVFHTVNDILAYHAPLGSGVIAAAGSVGKDIVCFPAEISAGQHIEAESFGVVDMVIYHVHDNTQSGVMEGFHHLFHFFHTDFSMEGVCCIASFGNVEVGRIIAPVILLSDAAAFIHTAIVIDRQKMHMGDTQLPDVGNTGGHTLFAGFCKP